MNVEGLCDRNLNLSASMALLTLQVYLNFVGAPGVRENSPTHIKSSLITPSKLSPVVQKSRERKWLLCRHIWCARLHFVPLRSFFAHMEIFSKLFQMDRIKKQGQSF